MDWFTLLLYYDDDVNLQMPGASSLSVISLRINESASLMAVHRAEERMNSLWTSQFLLFWFI